MKISPARIAAYRALLRIERDGAFSSAASDSFEAELAELDRRLAHELILGCLRSQIILDDTIDLAIKGRRLDVEIRVILRLGIYQIHFTDKVPMHAAVNESVELVKYARKSSAKGLVNAVLRRSSPHDPESFADAFDHCAYETSHPRWLIEKWAKQFGRDVAMSIAKANNRRSELTFRHTAKELPDGMSLSSFGRESEIAKGCYIANGSSKELREAARDGLIAFQEAGSQMVPVALKVDPNSTVLDLCAAPGGKTELLASRAKKVIAGELHDNRLRAMTKRFQRNGYVNIECLRLDATQELQFDDESFDHVLLDAPCSGTGTIRNNPEIRYRITADDIDELSRKQNAMLVNSARVVKIGGELLYSTCSLEMEEGEQVVERFLSADDRFEIVRPLVADSFITSEGFARTFPHRDGMDGFFIARIKRIR